MKKYTNKVLKIVPYIALSILVGVTAVYAGSTLTPPASVSNTMYSLTDIYNLASGKTADEGTGEIDATPSEVSLSGKSLSDVYEAISTEIAKLTPSILLSGNTVFGVEGEAEEGSSSVEFASADVSSYQCSWFTGMTDPDDIRATPITSQEICTSNPGCTWDTTTTPGTPFCAGGEQTSKTYMTWYAAKKACENYTEGGFEWRLPTNIELITHYMDNNIDGVAPEGFVGAYYWSGTTFQYPEYSDYAYEVSMGYGYMDEVSKYTGHLARCAH
jgi:hypothetical protein